MMRTFNISLLSNAVSYNLLTLLLATTGAVPTDGYFPNPCAALNLVVTGGSTITVADKLGYGFSGLTTFERKHERNMMDLGEYYLKGSANPTAVEVGIEAT